MKMSIAFSANNVALFFAFTFVAGCVSRGIVFDGPISDGICRTSASHDTFEELYWGSIRRFPADLDERQCAIMGTNEWVRVEPYPDGTPCRIVRGGVKSDGKPDDITTAAIEYDFSGNVLSCYSLYDLDERNGVAQPTFTESCYWRDFRRVIRAYSHLALDCYYALYYYQESESCLKVCVWTLDRKKKSMDKLVLNVKLVNGCAVPDAAIDTHIGELIDFDGIAVDPDGCVRIKALIKDDSKALRLSMPIEPVQGKNSICNAACIRRNELSELVD